MKTTVEISDLLFERAKDHALQTGQPMRAVIEEGLRRVLDAQPAAARYRLPDRSVGVEGDPNPLANLSWEELRAEIYGGSGR